ncbi:hypothetical protein [Bradyrhizobium septentrionale]|uniref:DUF2721 domain-containing protein n=1 Tax=Bradyrhizobium septentrionale TaxID=1404411 RepID=A0ABZ2NP24_9BRAD
MSVGDWIGIVSLVLVIPLGIATNLLTPRFVAYLERRKLIKSIRSKEQEIKAYHRVKAFKDGIRDKYPHYILLATLCVCFELIAVMLALVAFVNFPISIADFFTVQPARLILGVLTGGFFVLGFGFLAIISDTERRLEKFDEYTAEVRRKWGGDDVA